MHPYYQPDPMEPSGAGHRIAVLTYCFYMVIFVMVTMMTRTDFETAAGDILERSRDVALATQGGDGYPHVRMLFNLRCRERFPTLAGYFRDKGLAVYLSTNTSSLKVRQVGLDARVTAYLALPSEIRGLMLSGSAVPDAEAKAALWVDGWERYYPQGQADPDYTVLRIDAVLARGWYAGAGFEFAL
jgi:general stress protein 26